MIFRILTFTMLLFLSSCHESIEDKAMHETKSFTEKYCPTPEYNNVITDSITFEKKTKTYHYYCTLTGIMDNEKTIVKYYKKIKKELQNTLRSSTNIKIYKEAGFNFSYTCFSQKNPQKILATFFYPAKDLR